MSIKITKAQLLRAIPNTYLSRVDDFISDFNEYSEQFGIDTPARVVHFLAQCFHESGELKHTSENLNYSADALLRVFPKYFRTRQIAEAYARQPEKIANRVYASRMGNDNEASGDGWRFRGRGFIQLTGRSNYQQYAESEYCRGDLMSHPEWLSQSPGNLKSAMYFWKKRNLNEIADRDDGGTMGESIVEQITRKVNGGLNGISDRKYHYRRFKKEFGL